MNRTIEFIISIPTDANKYVSLNHISLPNSSAQETNAKHTPKSKTHSSETQRLADNKQNSRWIHAGELLAFERATAGKFRLYMIFHKGSQHGAEVVAGNSVK